jgi:hypothetical protein
MSRLLTTAAFVLVLTNSVAHAVYPGATWAQRTPESQGLDRAKLAAFRAATGNQAGVIIKNGFLVLF